MCSWATLMFSSVFSYLLFHLSNWQFEGLFVYKYLWVDSYEGYKYFLPVRRCNLFHRNVLHFNEVKFVKTSLLGIQGFLSFYWRSTHIFCVYIYIYKFICKIRSCNMWGYVIALLLGLEGEGPLHVTLNFPISLFGRSWALSSTLARNEFPSLCVAWRYSMPHTGFALGATNSVHLPLDLSIA